MAAVNRRERNRQQTVGEILDAARGIVAVGEDLTLRAAAREVGLSAPALYRYVDSLDDLSDQLGGRLFDELVDELVQARDGVSDAYEQLQAMAWAFRGWALEHRFEFGLLFANPLHGLHHDGACTGAGAKRFGAAFAEVFAQVWQERQFAVPADADLDPSVRRQLEQDGLFLAGLPLGWRYLFLRQWARLYGTVTLEAFGHLSWALTDTAPLFEAMLADSAAELGID